MDTRCRDRPADDRRLRGAAHRAHRAPWRAVASRACPSPGSSATCTRTSASTASRSRSAARCRATPSATTSSTRIRDAFNAGDPVDFVADITTATELEQVLIEGLHVEEVERRRRRLPLPHPPAPVRRAAGATARRSTTSVPTSRPTSTHWPTSASTASSCRTCSATSRRSATRRRRSRPALEGVKTAVAPLNDLLDGLRGVFA